MLSHFSDSSHACSYYYYILDYFHIQLARWMTIVGDVVHHSALVQALSLHVWVTFVTYLEQGETMLNENQAQHFYSMDS